MIINSDQDSLLIEKNGNLFIRNLNEYNILKHKDFDGNRINLSIGHVQIIETFNDGIFNIIISNDNNDNKLKFQVNKNIELCKRILFNDEKKIIEFLQNETRPNLNQNFLEKSLTVFWKNLKFTNDGIIINKMFKVDRNAQAYFIKNDELTSLCIVAVNSENFKMQYDHNGLGNQQIDFKTLEILHKVLFLLNPVLDDSVFTNQLPKSILKKLVQKEIKNE